MEMIPVRSTIGIGDSVTLRQTGILTDLSQRGNKVVNPFRKELTQDAAKRNPFIRMCRRSISTDVFMTSCNAVTEDGKIVSIDYAGNRVAGMVFGGSKVVLVAGKNKIVPHLDEAISRIKNVIAPFHAKYKGRNTPCAATGVCTDCHSPARLCNVTVILERNPGHTDSSIILVDQDLGLAWDPAWDEERIREIKSGYCQNSWAFFTNETAKPQKVPN
jgi:hypothetical protein